MLKKKRIENKSLFACELLVRRTIRAALPTKATIAKWIQAALERDAQISLLFVGSRKGRRLNFTYRGVDHPTNVLTFDYEHSPVAIADIAICVPVIEREAKEQRKTFEEHLVHMIVHGVLHAQGYDHAKIAQARKMEDREKRILASLGFKNPYADAARVH